MPAARTLIHVPAECRGSAGQDGVKDFQMQPGEPLPTAIEKGLWRRTDDIGHLQRRPRHLFGAGGAGAGRKYRKRIQRTGDGAEMPPRHMQIDRGLFEVAMAQQELNGA